MLLQSARLDGFRTGPSLGAEEAGWRWFVASSWGERHESLFRCSCSRWRCVVRAASDLTITRGGESHKPMMETFTARHGVSSGAGRPGASSGVPFDIGLACVACLSIEEASRRHVGTSQDG